MNQNRNPLFDDIYEEDSEQLFGDIYGEEKDGQTLPPKRVTPGDAARQSALGQEVGSPLNRAMARPLRWIGSIGRTVVEGARNLRPIGVAGLSRQDEGSLSKVGSFLAGEQETMANIQSTDGRKLTYAPGTPEYRLQQQFQQAQARGDNVYTFAESDKVQDFMKQHKLKASRFGLRIGPVELFPGLADTFGTFGESAGLGINKLFGTQLFGNAENARQMWTDIADTFGVWEEGGMERFIEKFDADPGQVLADAGMLLMLKGKAAGGIGRGAVAAGKLTQANVRRNIVRSGVKLQRLDRVLNDGFRVPGVAARPGLSGRRGLLFERDAVGRLRTRMGASEIIDPEEWGARSAYEVPQLIASNTLSPFGDYVEPSYREALKAIGIDPSRVPATLQSRSQLVATKEAKREQEDHQATVAGLETAILGLETTVEEILAQTHASGDITEAGKAINQAYESFVGTVRAEAQKGYDRETPERRSFIMSLRNVWRTLYGEGGIIEESKALERSVGYSDFSENRVLQGFDKTMEEIQQSGEAGITEDFVEGTEPETHPLQGGERKQAGVDVEDVVDANRQGTARRLALSPTHNTYAVEYDVAPLERLVASHTPDGQPHPLFEALSAVVDGGTLQTRQFNGRMVRKIASDVRPEALLLDLMATDRGAPIAVPVEVDASMAEMYPELSDFVGETLFLVIAGNNRVQALELAQREYPADWTLYQEELPKVLPDYGFDMTHGQQYQSPVLYRKLLDEVNLERFAADSNVEVTRRMLAGEQAQQDALHLDTEVLGRLNLNLQGKLGDVLQDASNIAEEGGVRMWLQKMEAESGEMYVETTDPADGSTRTELTKQGIQRLENAIFRRIYSSPKGLKMLELFETVQNSNIRNIEKAVNDSLLAVARVEVATLNEQSGVSPAYRIADAVAEAVVGAWQITRTGAQDGLSMRESLKRYLHEQGELSGAGITALVSGVSRDILEVIERAIGEPSVLSGFLEDYGDLAVSQMPDTPMAEMMGAGGESQESLIYQLKDRYLGDGALDGAVQDLRPASQHMTTRTKFYQILKDGFIRMRQGLTGFGVFLSHGGGWGGDGKPIKYGFMFDPRVMVDKYKATPSEVHLKSDNFKSKDELNTYVNERLDETQYSKYDGSLAKAYYEVVNDFMRARGLSMSDMFDAPSWGFNEIIVKQDIDIQDAVGVIKNDKPQMITEETRGLPPEQWKYRDPTAEELGNVLVVRGEYEDAFMLSSDAPPGATRFQDTGLQSLFQNLTPQNRAEAEAEIAQRQLEDASSWTDADRQAYVSELVDSGYYRGDWMNRAREMYERTPELASALFDADTAEAAIEKWTPFVLENFVDVFDVETKVNELRVELSERKKSFNVKGREVSGHREIAVISQALRDAGREFMTVFYVDELPDGSYRIRGHETTTLNAPGQTNNAALSALDGVRASYGVNTKIVRLHNHPSAAASFSDGDKSNQNYYRQHFGENYLGDIVIDSGEYAVNWQRDTEAGGKVWEREEHVKLEADELGWDPQWPRTYNLATGVRVTAADRGADLFQPQLRQNDPMFMEQAEGNTQLDWSGYSIQRARHISAADLRRGLIRYGKDMQIDHNWTVFAMQGNWGRLNAVVQVKDFHKIPAAARADYLRNLSLDHGGAKVYVYVGQGDWYNSMGQAVDMFRSINDDPKGGGVMAVMVHGFTRGWLNPETDYYKRMWQPEYMERTGSAYDVKDDDKLVGAHSYARNRQFFGDNPIIEQELLRLHAQREAIQDPGEYAAASEKFNRRLMSDYVNGMIDPENMHIDLLDLLIAPIHNSGKREDAVRLRKLFDERKSLELSKIFERSPSAMDTPPPERTKAKPQTDFDHTLGGKPYTYGDAEAFSTMLRRKIEALERSETSNPQELRWYKKLRNALEADMDESLRAHRPDLADKIDAIDLAYAQGMTKMNSAYAKHIMRNVGSDLVEGTDNYRNMVKGLFSPGMDVASVGLVYELVGGFDSDAGRRMRRVFMEQLFSEAIPPRARAESAKRKRGKEGRLRAWQRISPGGIGSALGKWQKNSGAYPAELLEAILGKDVVDTLYDLDSVSMQFARIVQKLGGSQTAPWVMEFLRSDYRTERLWQILRQLGGAFGIGAGGGAMIGAGTAMSLGFGAISFLTAWLGSAAVGKMMDYMKDRPVGKRYLLEGTVVSMAHVLTGDPMFASPDVAARSRAKVRGGRSVARPSTLRAIRRLGRPRDKDEEQ